MMNQVKNESEQVSEQMCKRETEKKGCRQKYVEKMMRKSGNGKE